VGKLGEDLQLYLKHVQVRSVWNRQHQSLWCVQVLCLVDDRFPGQVRQSATLESLVVALGDNIKTLLAGQEALKSDVQSLKEGQEAMQSDIQSLKEGQETQAKEALRLRSDLLDVRKESVDYFIKSMGTKG